MIEAARGWRSGTIIATGNTSALRGKANFAGFAPTKAAQRILAESIARDLGSALASRHELFHDGHGRSPSFLNESVTAHDFLLRPTAT